MADKYKHRFLLRLVLYFITILGEKPLDVSERNDDDEREISHRSPSVLRTDEPQKAPSAWFGKSGCVDKRRQAGSRQSQRANA